MDDCSVITPTRAIARNRPEHVGEIKSKAYKQWIVGCFEINTFIVVECKAVKIARSPDIHSHQEERRGPVRSYSFKAWRFAHARRLDHKVTMIGSSNTPLKQRLAAVLKRATWWLFLVTILHSDARLIQQSWPAGPSSPGTIWRSWPIIHNSQYSTYGRTTLCLVDANLLKKAGGWMGLPAKAKTLAR